MTFGNGVNGIIKVNGDDRVDLSNERVVKMQARENKRVRGRRGGGWVKMKLMFVLD